MVLTILIALNGLLLGGAVFARGVLKFICVRMLVGELSLLIVSIIIFTATQLLPSDVAQSVLGRDATPERVAALRQQWGLDRPMLTQYLDWLGGMITGDPGTSFVTNVEITSYLSDRVVNSLFLLVLGAIVSVPLSLLIGAITARKRDSLVDVVTTNTMLVLASLPEFVVGLTLVIVFSTGLWDWLPAVVQLPPGARPWTEMKQLVLPTITLVVGAVPYISRVTRISLIEVLESDYVEMARLKGAPERTVLWRHALPNALGPVLQVIALNVAYFAAGVIVVEFLFNYPGIGGAMRAGVRANDVQVVQYLAMVLAGVYVVTNLLADVGTILVTPRLRTRVQ
jgi:peptide/nickel transport system permease protein